LDRERTFDALFRANYAGLCRIATRILGSPAQAEELVQDLFLWVWERCLAIDESTPSRAYLYRAAHNAVLNRLRRQRIEQRWREEQPDGSVQHLPPVGQSDVQERLRVQQLLFHHRPHDDDRPAGQVVVLQEAVGGGKEGGWQAYDSVPGTPSLSTPESSDA